MASDGHELYVFDSRGRHLRPVDALGGVQLYAFRYDAPGGVRTVTDRDGKVTTIERDASGDITAIVSPYGQRAAVTLDANGHLAPISNPNNETTGFSYTADGLLTRVTDARSNTTLFTYDDSGRVTSGTGRDGELHLRRLAAEERKRDRGSDRERWSHLRQQLPRRDAVRETATGRRRQPRDDTVDRARPRR